MKHLIHGSDLQILEIVLPPAGEMIAEPGAVNFMEDDIKMNSRLGDGSEADKGLFSMAVNMAKRVMSGEKIFVTSFTNKSNKTATLGFTAPFPGKIIPINLNAYGGEIICQKGSFLAAEKGTHIALHLISDWIQPCLVGMVSSYKS